jgi:hypothetical protein
MVKRFTETTKWSDPWFMDLPVKYKAFWFYICDQCDCAGVWEPNMRLATTQVGEPLELAEVLRVFGRRIEQTKEGKLWIAGFIRFQYGFELNNANTAHRGVLKRLEVNKIEPPVQVAPFKPLPRGYKGLQDKDKDKEGECEGKPNFLNDLKKDPFNAGVDIDRELELAKRWCKKKGRRCTERFFKNWISRADRIVPDPPKKPKPQQPQAPQPTEEEIAHRKATLSKEIKDLRDKFKMP